MLCGQAVDGEVSPDCSRSSSAGAERNDYRKLVLDMIEKMHSNATKNEEDDETSTLGFLGELTIEQARELSTTDLLAKMGDLSESVSSTSKDKVWIPWWESFASGMDQTVGSVIDEENQIQLGLSSWSTTVCAVCFYLVLHRRCRGVWCDVYKSLLRRLLNAVHTAVTDLQALIRMVRSVVMLELDFAEPSILDQMRSDASVVFSNVSMLKEAISQLSDVSGWTDWTPKDIASASPLSWRNVSERVFLAFETFQTEPVQDAVHTLHLEMDKDPLADDFSCWNPLDDDSDFFT